MLNRVFPLLLLPVLLLPVAAAQSPQPVAPAATDAGPQTNSSVIDANGTAHITRVVPIPTSLSPEAQATLRHSSPYENTPLPQRRIAIDAWQAAAGARSAVLYPVNIQSTTLAGIPVRDITPRDAKPLHPGWVLLNLHGGGFNSDSGSLTESIPLANLTHTRVVAVLYRLAPEHPYPAAAEDAISVYRELLKTYKPSHIVIFGTSAGAILTAEVAVRLRTVGLPEPAALGIFSGLGDFSQPGDSFALYTLRGFTGSPALPDTTPHDSEYFGSTDPKTPLLSPIYADLHALPPPLFISSGRDMLLSGTTTLHRAFLRSGVDARLIVFEGLPHAFWNDVDLPESREAYEAMARFFTQQLNRQP